MQASIASMNPSPNLYLIGPMGAGKTSIGRHLADQFSLPFIDLDHALEERHGIGIPLMFELEGEAAFRRRESAMLGELVKQDGVVLSTGGGAVLDADNRRQLSSHGFVVWLDVDVETQLQRLRNDRQRPLLAAQDRRAKLEQMAQVRNPLYAEIADLRIPASPLASSSSVSRRLAAHLARNWIPTKMQTRA
jgi:shikimate kinase